MLVLQLPGVREGLQPQDGPQGQQRVGELEGAPQLGSSRVAN